MRMSDLFPSNWLKADDFEQPRQLKIKELTMEELGEDKQKKPVVYFVGEPKGLVLNKTNFEAIVNAVGDEETDNWIGQAVELYRATTQFRGMSTPCVRVRAPRAQRTQSGPAPQSAPGAPHAAEDGGDPWTEDIPDDAPPPPRRAAGAARR